LKILSENIENVKFDKEIPNLLLFPNNEKLNFIHNLPMLEENNFIIQDKSSCIPPFILQKYLQSFKINLSEISVFDACAAPGNKTLQLLEYFGSVFATEKDQKRYQILYERIGKYAPKDLHRINIYNQDFRFLKENELDTKINYILLDTSCSGSGNQDTYENEPILLETLSKKCVNEIDYNELFTKVSPKMQKKVTQLSEFQKEILQKAFEWEKIDGIIYSTCSIFPQENEEVIKFILEKYTNFELAEISNYVGHNGFIVFFFSFLFSKSQILFECAQNVI